jgi:hypothetical protein
MITGNELMSDLEAQNASTLDTKSEEIELIPSNLQLFLACLGILALLVACFAAGYLVGKRNPRLRTSEEITPHQSLVAVSATVAKA